MGPGLARERLDSWSAFRSRCHVQDEEIQVWLVAEWQHARGKQEKGDQTFAFEHGDTDIVERFSHVQALRDFLGSV